MVGCPSDTDPPPAPTVRCSSTRSPPARPRPLFRLSVPEPTIEASPHLLDLEHRHVQASHNRVGRSAPLSALPVAVANAQDSTAPLLPQRRWTLSAVLEVVHAGAEAWGRGPALALRHDFDAAWGVELRAALPAFAT